MLIQNVSNKTEENIKKIESVYLHTMNIKELEENSRRQRLLLLYQCIEKMWNFASELSCSSDKDRIDKYMTSIVQ